VRPPPRFDPELLVRGVRAGERAALGRAITLMESGRAEHRAIAAEVLDTLLPHTGAAVRVGISGVPGVGKSTFIEALGSQLLDAGHRVAVLAVDPSSSLSGGSILGDKTRMQALANAPAAFVRPSPTRGTLGGVAARTREAMLLCEAAGYDVVIIETVGVGQSEVAVADMVDVFLLLLLAGAGDGLQGIKRGILEVADVLAIQKADGDNRARAEAARAELSLALQTTRPARGAATDPVVLTCSALEGHGVADVWAALTKIQGAREADGSLQSRRARQGVRWFWRLVDEGLRARFDAHPAVAARLDAVVSAVRAGALAPTAAATEVLGLWASPDRDRAPRA
jgi:LAO/AO transport system kinase